MKKKMLKKTLILSFVLLFLFSINSVQAGTVWQENFEGTIDDWDCYSYSVTGSGTHQSIDDPGYSVANGIFQAPNYSENDVNITFAFRNSTVAYGIWEFDWVASLEYRDLIEIIFNQEENNFNFSGVNYYDLAVSGYFIVISSTHSILPIIRLKKFTVSSGVQSESVLDDHNFEADLEGSYHVKVTRNSEGEFEVYFNDTLVLEATDTAITTSQKFGVSSWLGASGIDNITVSDIDPVIPATTGGYIVWTVIPTIILLVIVRKKIKYRN